MNYAIRYFSFNILCNFLQCILKASIYTALREEYILPDQYHSWLLLQYVLIKPYIFDESSNMYRANNTLVNVERNTYCGSLHGDDVRGNAYYSDHYGSLCNTYCLFNMLLDRGAQCILTVTIRLSIPLIRMPYSMYCSGHYIMNCVL